PRSAVLGMGSQLSVARLPRIPPQRVVPPDVQRPMNENPNPGGAQASTPTSARDLVAAMRRRSTEHLQAVLARVFARADDWLFDLAKKDGVPDGSPYLFAMRALRTSRAP